MLINKTKMKKTNTTMKTKNTHYEWVERNITKIGPTTYRIRVGTNDGYASSKTGARLLKRSFLNK